MEVIIDCRAGDTGAKTLHEHRALAQQSRNEHNFDDPTAGKKPRKSEKADPRGSGNGSTE